MKQILELPISERSAAMRKLSDEDFKALIDEAKEMAKAEGIAISPLLNNSNITAQKQGLAQLLNKFPEASTGVLKEDTKEQLDKFASDWKNKKLTGVQKIKLLNQNFFEDEDGIKKFSTFLTYVGARDEKVFMEVIFFLERNLSPIKFKNYLELQNQNGIGETTLDIFDTYLKDHGNKNAEERNKATEAVKEQLTEIQLKVIENKQVVRVDNVDTHLVSNHKSADESHVSAFKRMVEANKIEGVEVSYVTPLKESDPSRELNIRKNGKLDSFVNVQLESLQKEINAICKMSDSELFENYVRYNEVAKFASLTFAELDKADKRSFGKKIEGFRFQANTAKRYVDEMFSTHRCASGTYSYDTNRSATCGLTMEQMLASAYFAARDVENFRKDAKKDSNTPTLNKVALVMQLHDIRRGYDIDSGKDKPDDFEYPKELGNDNNRCHGGGVNSLAAALQSTHKLYNVKKIERSDIEREIKKIYIKIVIDNLEEIKKYPQDLEKWSVTNKVSGDLRELLKQEFEEKHLKEFESDFKGYVADNTYFSIIENALNNLEVPQVLKTEFSIESLTVDEIVSKIKNDSLPLLIADKEKGHISTLNYLASLRGNETLLLEVLQKIKESDISEPSTRVAMQFLARSNLSNELGETEIFKVRDKSIKLKQLAALSEKDIEVLRCGRDIAEYCIENYRANLFEIYALNVGIMAEELNGKFGSYKKTPLHYAAMESQAELAKLLIEKGADVNAKDSENRTPLHHAASTGSTELAKLLIEKDADVNAKDNYGDTPLHYSVDRGRTELVKLLIENGADVNAKNSNGITLLHYAASHSHREIGKLLIEKGADISVLENSLDRNATRLLNFIGCDVKATYDFEKKAVTYNTKYTPKVMVGTAVLTGILAYMSASFKSQDPER